MFAAETKRVNPGLALQHREVRRGETQATSLHTQSPDLLAVLEDAVQVGEVTARTEPSCRNSC